MTDRESHTPTLAAVVLVWRSSPHLDECLSALEQELAGHTHEIVVVVNRSSELIDDVLARHGTVRVLRPPVNLGFAGGCNAGVHATSMDLVAFVNDDAIVQPGWAAPLLRLLADDPDAAAAGSVLLDDDGFVLEAGGRFVDAVPHPMGRGEPADSLGPSRPVEWLTGCGLVVRREVFTDLGGFDESFHPAYFEDVDLSLRLRVAGWTVQIVSESRVVHHESASTSPVLKSFLFERSRRRFADKWTDIPAPSLPPRRDSARRPRRSVPRRVLVVDDALPDASKGSGMGRMVQHLRALHELGVEVLFHPASQEHGATPEIRDLGVEAVTESQVLAHCDGIDAVIVSRPHNMALAERLAAHHPAAPLVYDAEARFAARLALQEQVVESDDRAATIASARRAMEATEATIARCADAVLCISEEEAEWFRRHGARRVHVLSPFPDRVPSRVTPTFAERRGAAVLCGWRAGADSPNGDGIRWLAEEVLPRVHGVGDFEVRLSGGDPPRDLRHLESARLRFVGQVPDPQSFLDEARVALVPIRFGAGVKLKTVDALVAGVPVVTTTVGAEGIDEPWLPHMRVADDPQEIADALVELSTDPAVWEGARKGLIDVGAEWTGHAASEWEAVLQGAARWPSATCAAVRPLDQEVSR